MQNFKRFVTAHLDRGDRRFEMLIGAALGAIGGAILLLAGGEGDMWGLMLAVVVCGGPMNVLDKWAGRRLKALNHTAVAVLAAAGAALLASKFI